MDEDKDARGLTIIVCSTLPSSEPLMRVLHTSAVAELSTVQPLVEHFSTLFAPDLSCSNSQLTQPVASSSSSPSGDFVTLNKDAKRGRRSSANSSSSCKSPAEESTSKCWLQRLVSFDSFTLSNAPRRMLVWSADGRASRVLLRSNFISLFQICSLNTATTRRGEPLF